MASKKDFAIVILLLVVVVGVVFNRYYPNQSNTNHDSKFQTTTQPEPTSAPLSIMIPAPEIRRSSGSQITIQSSASEDSVQPVSDLKLGVYENDPAKSLPSILKTIDWSANGSLERGQSRNSSKVYFRNEGNVTIRLYLSTSNWAFQDVVGKSLSEDYQQYFTLTWDYDNSATAVNETRPITFTLTISPDCKDVVKFSFSVIVSVTP